MSAIEGGVDDLPGELEKLFSHLLLNIGSISRRKTACRTLSMVMTARTYKLEGYFDFLLTLDMYYFLDEYEKNPNFAVELSASQLA
jgi:hypothetical protein